MTSGSRALEPAATERSPRVLFDRTALIGVGLVSQTRDGTTLICHTNYPLMRDLIEYMVEQCCAEGTCAPAGASKLIKAA